MEIRTAGFPFFRKKRFSCFWGQITHTRKNRFCRCLYHISKAGWTYLWTSRKKKYQSGSGLNQRDRATGGFVGVYTHRKPGKKKIDVRGFTKRANPAQIQSHAHRKNNHRSTGGASAPATKPPSRAQSHRAQARSTTRACRMPSLMTPICSQWQCSAAVVGSAPPHRHEPSRDFANSAVLASAKQKTSGCPRCSRR